MRVLSIEYKNGISKIISSHFDKAEISIYVVESIEQLIFLDFGIYNYIVVDLTHYDIIAILRYLKNIKYTTILYLVDDQLNFKSKGNCEKEKIVQSFTRPEIIKFISTTVNHLNENTIIRHKNISIEEDNGILRLDNKILNFTKTEVAICAILIKNIGNCLSLERIIRELSYKNIKATKKSIREHIRKIRIKFKKFHLNPVITVTGSGYEWINYK